MCLALRAFEKVLYSKGRKITQVLNLFWINAKSPMCVSVVKP